MRRARRYVMVVEHDLAVLDYMSDYVCCLYGDAGGYGVVTKALHWATVVLLAAQFTVGYALTGADAPLEWAIDRWLGGDEEGLLWVHVGLGLSLLVVAAVRTAWRVTTPLPPWAEVLSARERRVASLVERVLYWLLWLIPASGLALLLLGGEDWELAGGSEFPSPFELVDDDVVLAAHVATHVAFFATLALHVGLVLRHTVVSRDGLLRRML